jgi:membrane associated rhomboid family serine protease
MILPLNDSIPSIHKPYAAWGVIIATAAVFLLQKSGGDAGLAWSVLAYGLTPKATFNEPLHFLTYTLLHGGWWHAISNMWIFWIFADNVEDVMGPWRFLAFYAICGVIAGVTHSFVYPQSGVPVVGASGAISGVLGAYFLLYPHARITTLVFFIILRLPAAVYLGGWFLLQLVSGLTERSAGIAWWAHLGGFVAGLILLPLFRKNRPVPAVLRRASPPPPPDDPKDPWTKYRSK